jgi:hypothetical protein
LDQFSTLYADARKWQQQGWLDYLTPQLYWPVDSEGQSYPRLLAWWADQNVKRRHLWPGNFTSRVRSRATQPPTREAWSAAEIVRQIEATREQPGATGNVHFSMKALMHNYGDIADKLKNGLYAEPALVPESKWLAGGERPGKPVVRVARRDNGLTVEMAMRSGELPWQWLVRVRTDQGWKTAIVPGGQMQHTILLSNGEQPRAVTVAGVTRLSHVGQAERAPIDKAE